MIKDLLIASFYSNDKYYETCAEALKGDCTRLGLAHRIEKIEFEPEVPWHRKCLYKIHFLRSISIDYDCPVIWLDVDSRLLNDPRELIPEGIDFAAYLRSFKPSQKSVIVSSRFWHPAIVFYGRTSAAKEFLDHLSRTAASAEGEITDDYVLQESWVKYGESLRSFIIPGDTIILNESEPRTGKIIFLFGSSGNVKGSARLMTQHSSAIQAHRSIIVEELVRDAMKRRAHAEALLFARAAAVHEDAPVEAKLRLANVLSLVGERRQALEVLESAALGRDSVDRKALSRLCDFLNNTGEEENYQRVKKSILERQDRSALAVIESWDALRHLDQLADAAGWKTSDRPAFWWMRAPYPGNLGDMLTPYLIYKLYGVPVRWAKLERARAIGIGSIGRLATAEMFVWGSGVAREADTINTQANWCAVRGPRTLRLLRCAGVSSEPALGDPALLLPRAYRPPAARRSGVVFVPHISQVDWITENVSFVSKRFDESDVRVLSPAVAGFATIEQFLDELCSAECVLSSSLHGIVIAHAYGVKARWVHCGGSAPQISGDGLKFHDYFESVGLRADPFVFSAGEFDLDDALSRARTPVAMPDLDALAAAMPFKSLTGGRCATPAVTEERGNRWSSWMRRWG